MIWLDNAFLITKDLYYGQSFLTININNLCTIIVFKERNNAKDMIQKLKGKNSNLTGIYLSEQPVYADNKIIYEDNKEFIDSSDISKFSTA